MGIKVDRWGNVWNEDDTDHLRPAWPHPELLASQARCPCVKEYVFRTQTPQGEFEWRCACGKVFPGLHH